MRDSRGRSPRPVPVSKALTDLKLKVQPETMLAGAQAAWDEAVGERIASVTEVVEGVDGVLYVDCKSSVWSQELSLMEPRLKEILAATMDGEPPRELRFRSVS